MNQLNKLYLKRKKEIEKRLDDFSRVKGDELFYELCFCLLTPQSSAFRSDEKIRILKEKDFLHKSFDPHPIIKDLRFHNNRNKYLKELKKNFSKLKFDREWLVENIKGLGYKEASLPYYEKVLVIVNNSIKFVRISKFYDNYKNGYYKNDQLKIFSFNLRTLKYEICPITNVFEHNYKGDLYKINLVTGRKIDITGDHSIFGLKNAEVVPIEVRNIKIGDFIAVPRRLNVPIVEEKELNIVELFIKKKILKNCYLRSKEYCKYLRDKHYKKLNRKNQYTQYFRGIVPLEIIKRLPTKAYSKNILKKYDVRLGFKKSPTTIKTVIRADEDFFWVLGISIAEAYVDKNPIEITLGLEEYERHLKLNRYLEEVFGARVKSYKPKNRNVYISKINNLGFFYLINYILEMKENSLKAKVPTIIFNSSYKNKIAFLQGYWEGDGWKRSTKNLSVSTSSIRLADSLLYLFLTLGIVARVCKKNNVKSKGGPSYCVEVDNIIEPIDIKNRDIIRKKDILPYIGNMLYKIHRDLKIKSKINSKHTSLYQKIMVWKHGRNQPTRRSIIKVLNEFAKYKITKEILLIKRLLDSDLSFFKVNNIKRIKYDKDYVYDIEVASENKNYQNFVGGFGGISLHNSHFLRNTGHRNLAILDRHILKNLVKLEVIDQIPRTLTRKRYLEIEKKFKEFSSKVKIPMDHLDLLFWSLETGKIFK